MFRILSPRRAAVVGVLGMALLAACGGNDAGSTGNQSAAPPTTASSMTASGPFGAACSAVPASGAGSLDALAQDPVATAASNTPDLSTLVTAVKKADLVDTLNSAQGITVFAPTNDAFSALPKPTLDQLAGSHKTLQGGTIQVSGSGQDFKVNGTSSVVCGNIKTANATVYLIDQVLLPNS